jgi:hypothetical protein
MKKAFCFLLVVTLYWPLVFAQSEKKSEEINSSPRDSLQVYRSIEKFAKKRGLTGFLYREIFNLPDKNRKKEKQKKQVDYQKYKGRIIRRIYITSLDPFGFSVQDTNVSPKSFIQKSGNVLHQRSARSAIRDQLLFSAGDSVDILKIKESERILRASPHVREVFVYMMPVKNTDSVDVYLREQDVWTKSGGVAINSVRNAIVLSDKNFLGLSHFLKTDYSYYKARKLGVFSGEYSIPYLKNTFITTNAFFNSDPENFIRGLSFNRGFFSPLTKWAGGADFFDVKATVLEINPEVGELKYAVRQFSQDYWVAKSFPLSRDSSEEARSTRIIGGLRYYINDYKTRPPEFISPGILYANSKMILSSIGLSNRTYYSDYYIYRYGVQEDVPSGRLFTLLFGYETKTSGVRRLYGGFRAATGNHFDNFGYVTSGLEAGSFFHNGYSEQGVVKLYTGYFSDLFHIGPYSFRQFVKTNMTIGFNRFKGETINLNEDNGIKGFESNTVKGDKKILLSLQTQAYLPYDVIGFHFAPFIFLNFGMVADNNSFSRSRVYQGYGVGLLIKNELLVISTFQVSLAIYPSMPGSDEGYFRFNPVKSYDFRFSDFDLGKPAMVGYQ